jgi:hypothetical protein
MMMHDSGDWHWGAGFGHWALGLLFWLLVVLALVALVKYVFGGRKK